MMGRGCVRGRAGGGVRGTPTPARPENYVWGWGQGGRARGW